MAQVISFINYKGGVGKTTMAVEIAATLASKHQFKVLIVDLDPQTNASFYLMPGENPEKPWQEWVDSNGSLKSVLDAAIREEPSCHADLQDLLPPAAPVADYAAALNKGHGRVEPREC